MCCIIIFSPGNTALPRLSELQFMITSDGEGVEIIKSVASEWQKICVQMDFDPAGNTLELITQAERGNPVPCCMSVFRHWLKGNGLQPITWNTLLRILKRCGYLRLAEKVKAALQTYGGQYA